jgi:hypothetical protein
VGPASLERCASGRAPPRGSGGVHVIRRDELRVVGEVRCQPLAANCIRCFAREELVGLKALLRLHLGAPRHRFLEVGVTWPTHPRRNLFVLGVAVMLRGLLLGIIDCID